MSSNPTHGERCTWYNIMWWGLSVTCNRLVVFSGYSGSSTNKTDCHIITEILFKVVLNTITLTLYHSNEFPHVVATISLFHCNIKYILDIIDSTLSENSHSSLHVQIFWYKNWSLQRLWIITWPSQHKTFEETCLFSLRNNWDSIFCAVSPKSNNMKLIT